MALALSCAFATSLDSPDHARVAENLGYKRAWFYDSPPLYPDVWVQLCRAAERTDRIGLATGLLVPHVRHPMATAATIATLVDAAGEDRVAIDRLHRLREHGASAADLVVCIEICKNVTRRRSRMERWGNQDAALAGLRRRTTE